MENGFPLFPDSASSIADSVDSLYFVLIAISGTMSILIFGLVFYFAVRYRERKERRNAIAIEGNLKLEIAWSVLPFVVSMGLFLWAASVYIANSQVPPGALELQVVGKQWMWKIQHPDGRREINELHVPLGQPIRLTLASEDVIHSFFIPAFRIKQDVVPGRYTTMWFEPTKAGAYHLFCAEYCGTQHSGMVGRVYVLEPRDYEEWLAGGTTIAPTATGAELFERFHCVDCHSSEAGQRGPALAGRFGKEVQLEDGSTILFDEAYFRESVVTPNAKIVAGYEPVMPTFRGQINEEELMRLMSHVKSLASQPQRLER